MGLSWECAEIGQYVGKECWRDMLQVNVSKSKEMITAKIWSNVMIAAKTLLKPMFSWQSTFPMSTAFLFSTAKKNSSYCFTERQLPSNLYRIYSSSRNSGIKLMEVPKSQTVWCGCGVEWRINTLSWMLQTPRHRCIWNRSYHKTDGNKCDLK